MFIYFATFLLTTGAFVRGAPVGFDVSMTPSRDTTSVSLKDAGIISHNSTTSWETGALLGNETTPRVIQPYEVLLYGNGRLEIVHEDIYNAMLAEDALFSVNASTPVDEADAPTNGTIIVQSGNDTSPIDARCTWYQAVQIQQTQNFLNWDVPMSSVVQGDRNGKTTISVTSGYTIANSIGVSASSSYTFIKDVLQSTLSISYTKTWTSSYAVAYTFGVTPWKYGVVVSRPRTTRRTGRHLAGCVGSMKTVSTFTADSYYQGSFNSLNWVQGAITTCERSSYPVARCLGGGHLY
jgi:hypothetical protein